MTGIPARHPEHRKPCCGKKSKGKARFTTRTASKGTLLQTKARMLSSYWAEHIQHIRKKDLGDAKEKV